MWMSNFGRYFDQNWYLIRGIFQWNLTSWATRRPHRPLFCRHALCSHESNVCIVLAIELVDGIPMDTVDRLSILGTCGALYIF